MKKILSFCFIFFVCFGNFVLAQDLVNGRPIYKERYFSDTGLVEWPTFADELMIESNLPVSLFVANVPELRQAADWGILKSLSPVYDERSPYPFTADDLALQRQAGLMQSYSVLLNTKSEFELAYWQAQFSRNPNLKVTRSPVIKATDIQYRDPFRHLQWYNDRIGLVKAHRVTTGSPHVYLIVGDTGVDPTHEDLPPVVWLYDSFSDQDGAGKDDFFHGTWVASIATAQINNKGIIGVAPDVKLASIKLLLNGSASIDQITKGVLKVAAWAKSIKEKDPQAQFVLNMSFGGIGDSGPFKKAVALLRSLGIVVVAAAGNDHLNLERVAYLPAGVEGVIAVAATNEEDDLASFSNYGGNAFIAAPGVYVIGAVPSYTKITHSSGYSIFNGTSASAPFVSANIALIMSSASKPLTEEQIRWRLYAGSDFIPGLRDLVQTNGRINLGNSVIETPEELSLAPADFTAWGPEHSGMRTGFTLPTTMLAFILHYSEKEFDQATLKREDVQHITVLQRESAGTETGYFVTNLKDNTKYFFGIQIISNSGTVSPLSRISVRATREALTLAKRNFEKNGQPNAGQWVVTDGSLANLIQFLFGANIQQWHLMKTTLENPHFVWRYGLKGKPHYNPGQPTDSILLSEVFDTAGLSGLSIRFKWFQELGDGKQNDVVEFYCYELDESNHLINPKFIKRFTPEDNTVAYPFEEKTFDLTERQGKKLVFAWHFLSLTDTNAYGIVMGDFEVRVNKN